MLHTRKVRDHVKKFEKSNQNLDDVINNFELKKSWTKVFKEKDIAVGGDSLEQTFHCPHHRCHADPNTERFLIKGPLGRGL